MDTGSIIPSWARVGAKCTCISVNPNWIGLSVTVPILHETYTLREVEIDPFDGEAICLLEEIPDQVCLDPGSEGFVVFGLVRFAPLVTRSLEADVSRFRKHLRVKRNKADAVVRIPHLGTIGK